MDLVSVMTLEDGAVIAGVRLLDKRKSGNETRESERVSGRASECLSQKGCYCNNLVSERYEWVRVAYT